ncbi:MAG: cation:proton antiporter [Flavipsychrobacter sp.]|nr:cation:proton antiporter [Flavipsychrobacter sp.]
MTQHLGSFLIQLIIIIITSRVFGYFFKKIGQPTVMGEILAGIFLGPSILGTIFPEYLQAIFPPGSLDTMRILSQIGLILFMFVVGMELDLDILKTKARTAVTISNASIIIPFSLGVMLAYFLHDYYAPKDVPFYAFALFMGIAMSITAFPVLARIIRERSLRDKRIEAIAMTSAAINDVTGWVALAFVIAIIKAHSFSNSVYTLLATVGYMIAMVFIVRPLMNKLAKAKENNFVKQSTVAIIFIVMLLSSLCTELIGVHALFGAFMAGVIMPQEWHFRQIITDKVEDVALILLLPLFFVITGLRTHINTVNTPILWAVTLLIIAIAVLGKLGGSAVAAKMTGENNYNSLSIGVLMNTRGLMELVILNIGYDLNILSEEIFTMMVIMALVTTFMTSPLLSLLDKYYHQKAAS